MRRIAMRVGLALSIASFALPALASTAEAQEAPKILDARPVQVLWDQGGRYAAGKDAVVVVALDAPVTPDAATHKAVVKLGGSTVATLAPLPATEPVRLLEFACGSSAECGGWKAGDYTFDITIGGATQTTGTFSFKDRTVVNVLAVSVRANYGTGDVRSVDEKWKTQGEFTRRVYPVAPGNFKWNIGTELDLSADRFNLKTDDGMFAVWEALAQLQLPQCREKPRPAGLNCYDKVVGFVRDRQGAEGGIQGYTMGSPANVVTATDEDAEATVAHEIGHPFELGDEYTGGSYHCKNNPTPREYVGKDWFNRANRTFNCADSTRRAFPFGGTGTLIEPILAGGQLALTNEGPYEVGGRRFLTPMVSFMGSGAKQNQNWITRDIWVRLFDGFDPAVKASSVEPQAARRFVSFLGEVDGKDAVTLEPWYSFTSTQANVDTTGSLFVRAVDATGRTLSTTAFTFDTTVAEPIPGFDHTVFQGVIAYPDATTKFEIVRGTTVLRTVNASRNAPVVTITSPRAGDRPTGEAKVTWTATDADGDRISTRVDYSPDNGKTWLEVEPEAEGSEVTLDFSELPGTGRAEAIFRVTSTDGINATQATSPAFTVAAKAPIAELLWPPVYSETQRGAAVFLYGEGLDLLDDVIIDDKVVWTSDRDGAIGKGALIETTKLSQGTHTITMTVTNSLGLKATATLTVVVHPAGRRATAADVWNVYRLYLGRDPVYPSEVVGWVGKDFGFLVNEVSDSDEAWLWLDAGNIIEAKSPFTGLRITR